MNGHLVSKEFLEATELTVKTITTRFQFNQLICSAPPGLIALREILDVSILSQALQFKSRFCPELAEQILEPALAQSPSLSLTRAAEWSNPCAFDSCTD